MAKMVLSIRNFGIDLWPHDATYILVTIDQAIYEICIRLLILSRLRNYYRNYALGGLGLF